MLQQTQVDRVVPKYRAFLKAFPTVHALASAELLEVLRHWSGLGYNRRAKMLHDAAKDITARGAFPHTYEGLRALHGVGDYTAKAVRVFAFNQWEPMLETNIRTVFLHHLFPRTRKVPDSKIYPYMDNLKSANPRRWYAALMDYGSYLKQEYPNPSRRSKHHSKQSRFKDSDRQIRGAILRAHLRGGRVAGFDQSRVTLLKKKMRAEGLI